MRDTSAVAGPAPGPRIYEKFAGDHPADKQSSRPPRDAFEDVLPPHVRYSTIPVAPVMTPEQLVFWLRGMADTGLLHIPDATTTLGVIFDAAQRAFTASPEPARPPCGCGGHR